NAKIDLRDNKVKPTRGAYFGLDFQVGNLPDMFDVRIQPEARGYIPLARGLTLGARATMGVLFHGYDIPSAASGVTSPDQLFISDYTQIQKLYFRGFFSGGPNSNRGYVFRGIGPRGIYQGFLDQGSVVKDDDCKNLDPTVSEDTLA